MGGKRSACVSLQFLVLLTASLALVSAVYREEWVVSAEFDPPRLKPSVEEYVVGVGGNLTLECQAKQPITWDLPTNQMIDDMQEAPSNISTSEDPHAEYPYKLRLELFNITAIDVGFYTCYFNTSENYEDDMNTLVSTGQARRIYVYVDDPEHLMVPMVGVVTGTQYSSLVVPCRPTSPNVQVHLYRDGSEVTDSVTFDPHTGFEFVIKSITENSITCIATSEGVPNNEHDIILILNSHTMAVPRPVINDSFNGNTVLGGKLHLDCFVTIPLGIPFHIKWKYPNEKKIDPRRVNISEATVLIKGNDDSSMRTGQSTIIIHNITTEDGGNYECEVYDANKNQNSGKKFIKVLGKKSSYIKLYEAADKNHLTLESGKFAKWAIQVDAFPIPTLTWFDNRNNEISRIWSEDHLTKYEVKFTPREAFIRINKLTLADTGIYRLQAKNEHETKDLNVTLVVTELPKVELGTKKFFMHGTIASIVCHVTGSPLPKLKWTFQPCVENCRGVRWEEKKGDVKVEGGYTVTSIIKIPVKQSGSLRCTAENINGTQQSTSAFYVSDVEDGFGIISNNKGNPIAVGDNVTLTCTTSIYTNFTETNWYKLPENKIIDNHSVNGVSIARKRTELSNEVIMSIPKITKSHIGTYACRALTTEEDGTNVDRQIKLEVHDAVKPNIAFSSMNSSEIQLSLGQQNHFFFCRATGIPTPEIRWYKDDVLMVFNDINPDDKNVRVKLTDTGKRLEFTHIKEEDRGKYTCKATSRVGEAVRSQSLALLNGDFKAGYIATIIVLAIVFFLLITYLIWKIRKEKRIRKQLSIDGLRHFEEGATESLNPELGLDEQAELLPYDKKWEFPREMLKLGKQLGSGAYGVVMKAVAQNIVDGEETTIVAVKQVKKTADSTFVKALASELKIMVHLGKHLNVVNLLGACTKNVTKHELFVIVEYCRFGNLHNYLLRHRGNFIDQVVHSTDVIDPTIGIEMINRAYSISSTKSGGNKYAALPLLRSGSHGDSGLNSGGHSPGLDTNNTVISMIPNGDIDGVIVSNGSVQPDWRSNYRGDYNYNRDVRPISTQDLLCWSFQVARGMEYLANRKVLHGDLAARNILLADDNIVKICDFGLAKSMYKNDNYKKKGDGLLPVKWMAIESIRDRVFSTQSDVWSYGIVLWELFSLASTPYPGMEADEKFYNRIIEGYRMEKPQYANKQIYETMLECWRSIPTHRPSFTQLAERLGYLLEDSVRKHYIDLNDPYMDMNSRWIAERGDSDYLAMMSSPDYGNLVSATATHDYVNDPFGGPTSVNPLSPDNMDTEGYLCMSPAKNGVITKDAPVFNFNTATPKRMPDLLDEDKTKPVELIPMLNLDNEPQRPGSDSDLGESNPTSPRSPHSPPDGTSFTNPSYQSMFKIPTTNGNVPVDDLIITKDNYVNMSKKDSGFCDSLDPKLSPSAFANPSYVAMNAKNKVPHIYNNVPSSTVV